MLDTETDERSQALVDNEVLRAELKRLRAENAKLRRTSQALREALDAHVFRARSTPSFGSIEMSAGTSIGPRRHATGRKT